MTKTHKKRYRAPAALLCLCMIFSMTVGTFSLPAAARAATPETTTPETAAPTPESTPKAEQATAETTPATSETAQATPETALSTPETAPPAPEPTPAAPESTGETENTPKTAAYKTAQAPRQTLPAAQKEIYVPKAPEEIEGAAACENIEQAIQKLPDGGILWLTEDTGTDTVAIDGGKTLTIKSYGGKAFTLNKTGGGENMLALSGGAALTLENVVLDAAANTAGRTVTAQGGATLTLGEGAVLQNNTAHGAVYLDGAMLRINGGSIKGNTAAGEASVKTWTPAPPNWKNDTVRFAYDAGLGENQGLGGAILMVNGSAFTISSGDVSGNKAACGGAVYAWGGSTITLGGGLISGNTADTAAAGTACPAAGGAIAVDNGDCVFTVEGAEIAGNTAEHGGAFWFGIDTGKLDFTMTSGHIHDNTAADGSVAYFLGADSLIDISGGDCVIAENTATGNGAFYVGMYPGNTLSERAYLTVRDGAAFSGNHAAKGSCLYLTRDKGVNGLTLEDAVFTDNEASGEGGVLRYGVPDSTFTVRGGTFTGNKTGTNGGCFYAAADAKHSIFTFENAVFKNNCAKDQGGVWRGFPPYADITYMNCTFDGNTAETGDGGCFYCPGDGPKSNVIIDGGTFTGNTSGGSGGAFRVNLNGGSVTVKGGAVFDGNTADVNAGAFSVRRKGAGYYGDVYLLECDILNNVCNADFTSYTASDRAATEHYNTGGVYIGENITCHMYDALITGNYVEKGYKGNMVGSGIGLCPNAEAYLYPEHGAMVCSNGDGNTMDILAVPYDSVITHETPARLYISDVTPDGEPYGWTDLNGNKARTGEYDWTNIRNSTESGIMTAALLDEYQGETTLTPVGFKANVAAAPVRTMALSPEEDDEYKVRIIGNSSRTAVYGGGGVMVNGKLIAGEFSVSVQKTVTVNGATDARKNALQTQQPFKFRFSIVDTDKDGSPKLKEPSQSVTFSSSNSGNGTLEFTKGTTDLTSGEDGFSGSDGTYDSLSCEFTIQGEDTLTFGRIKGEDIGINTDDVTVPGRYLFLLQETDSGGAAQTVITPPAKTGTSGPDDLVFTFTAANTFDFGTLELSKTVTGAMGEKDRLWTFDIDIKTGVGGTALSGTFPAELWEDGEKTDFTGTQGGLTFTDGKTQVSFDTEGRATVQLTDGQTLKIFDLPAGTTYAVSEREANEYGYTTTPANASGTIERETAAKPQFTNDRETAPRGSLRISKTVTGRGDRAREFDFRVEFTPKSLLDDAQVRVYKNGVLAPDLTIADGVLEFTLKNGEDLRVENLPVGTAYTVTEDGVGGYTTTVTDNDGDDDGKGIIVENREWRVDFVNDLPPTPTPRPTPGPKPTPTPTSEPEPSPTPCPTLTPSPGRTPGPGSPGGGPGHVPPTGDGAPLLLWTVLLLAALLGLTAVGIAYGKKKH